MVPKPRVCIIILNWNGLEDTVECLGSLNKITYPNYEIIVVDNGSRGNDAELLKQRFGDYIHVIENDKNYGFAEGCNIGMRYAIEERADYFLLLNNDTVVDSIFLDELIKTAENDIAGIVGPAIYFYDSPDEIQSRGGIVNLYFGNHLIGGTRQKGRSRDVGRFKQLQWCSGCAMMISQEVIDKVGMFDPEYFNYTEDVDLGYRIYKAGYKILCAEESKIWHKGGKSSGGSKFNPMIAYYRSRNALLFIKKHGRTYHKLVFISRFIFLMLARAVIHYRMERSLIKYRIRGLLQQDFVCCSNFKKENTEAKQIINRNGNRQL